MEIPARRPAWRDPRLIVGLALIAVSIILTTSIVSAARGGATVYRATQAILPGDVLGPHNIAPTRLDVDTSVYVTADALTPGATVSEEVAVGEILRASAIADTSAATTRRLVITVSDSLPSSVQAGDQLDLWSVQQASAGQSGQGASHLGVRATLVRVLEQTTSIAAKGTRIEILVDEASVGAVLEATAGKNSLAALPVGQR